MMREVKRRCPAGLAIRARMVRRGTLVGGASGGEDGRCRRRVENVQQHQHLAPLISESPIPRGGLPLHRKDTPTYLIDTELKHS